MKTSKLISSLFLLGLFACGGLESSLADKLEGQSYSIRTILVNGVDVTHDLRLQKSIAFYKDGKLILPDVQEPLENSGALFCQWSIKSIEAEEYLVIKDLVYGYFTGPYNVEFSSGNGDGRPNHITFSSDSIIIVAYKHQVF